MSSEKPPISEEKIIIPIDPRLDALPRVRLGPRSGNRDYGPIAEHGVNNLPSKVRVELDEGIFRARAKHNQMGVWSERVTLSDKEVAFFIYEAELWNNERRVFGEAYVVSTDRADEIEVIIKERTDAKRDQFIASLKKS